MAAIRPRLLLVPAAYLATAIGVLLSVLAAERAMRADVLGRAGGELQAIAELKVDALARWREDQEETARFVASYPVVASVAESTGKEAVPPELRQHAAAVLGAAARRYDFAYVGVFGPGGECLVGWPDAAAGAPIDLGLLGLSIERHGATRLRLGPDDEPVLDVAVPTPVQGATLTWLVFRARAKPRLDVLLAPWRVPSDSAGTLLVAPAPAGQIRVIWPRGDRAGGPVVTPQALVEPDLALVQIGIGRSGVVDGLDRAGGRAVRMAAEPLPEVGWRLATRIAVAEVVEPLWRPRALMLGLVGAFLAGGLAALLWWLKGEGARAAMEARVREREALHVTESKRAADELRASEQRFRQLAEAMQEVFWLSSPDGGRILYVSPAYEAVWGQSCQSLYERPVSWIEAIHPDDRPRMEAAWARCSEGYEEEFRIVRPDRSVRWIRDRANPVKDAAGRVISVAGLAADVTARKEAEQAVRRLVAAVEQAPVSIVVTDTTGLIQYVNPAFERITGYPAAEVTGLKPSVLKSGKHDAEFYRQLWAHIASGETWHGQLVNRRRSGELYVEDAVIAPVRDEGGAIRNYVGVKRDVTRELQLQEQVADAARLESIARLAGGVAHDFNNLLTVILSCSEALRDDLAEGRPPLLEDLDEIRGAAERARDLTRKLLAFARRQVIEPVPLDLGALVRDVEKLLRRLLTEDIALDVSLADGLWTVRCDRAQMEQLVLNLAVNARDAMPKGGRLSIALANRELGEADLPRFPGAQPGPHVALVVKDTGVGMAPEVKAHVFEPFFTTKQVGEGSGLGLATVYGIVRQSGGVIRVESEPGQGTTFELLFPRIVEAAVAAPAHPATVRGSETLLLVEDDPHVRGVVARALRGGGYDVVEVSTGAEALARVQADRDRVRMLVTDVVMPGMDGRQLAQEVRALSPGLRVLFVSGHAHDVLANRGVLPEGMDFLAKPFSSTALLERVRAALDR